MDIVINALPLLNKLTGIGKYIYYLSREIEEKYSEHEVTYFYKFCCSKKILLYKDKDDSVGELVRVLNAFPEIKSKFWELRDYWSAIHSCCGDVYFEPNFIPLKIKAKRKVTTVADFSFVTHPECHPAIRLERFRRFFWERIKQVDHVIFISDFIRRYAIEVHGFSENNSSVIPLGVLHDQFRVMSEEDLGDVRNRLNLPENYLLFVGSLEPRKNLERILNAYLSLPDYIRAEFKLILVGAAGWENNAIKDIIVKNAGDIRHLGYVTDEDLPRLYNLASLFVFTSLYEGFGLPALEAMACGCPVLSSNVTSLPEVCGTAAELVDPLDQEAIRAGMLSLLTDRQLSSRRRAEGLLQASYFTWEACAEKHLRVFQGVR